MAEKNFALKVVGLEALVLVLLGIPAFFYLQSVNDVTARRTAGQSTTPSTPPAPAPDAQAFSASYLSQGKSVKDLAAAIQFRPDVDLITFVIDTSASMGDDIDELKDNVKRIIDRYQSRTFEVVHFDGPAQIAGEPTRNLLALQKQIDAGTDLGGMENSYLALTTAAAKAREKFKHPAIVLMTDAAPNDGMPGSTSQTTMAQAADALNLANAELHVWAAFDAQEYQSNGSAATSDLYPKLVGLVKAGGQVYFVKRDNFDPNQLLKPPR